MLYFVGVDERIPGLWVAHVLVDILFALAVRRAKP